MTTRPFCIALALAACLTCRAQLTIEQCYEKARANYPLIKRYSLINKTEGIDLARAAKGYLPQLALSAQASVQSDVTDIPIDLGSIGVDGIEIPTMSRDQYKATIDLSQSIWDGGNISSRRKAVRAQAEADRRQTDVNLYAVNARVNRVFFGLLLVDAQLGQNRLLQDELASNCRRVEACMAGGLANQSDADALHVDLARARQAEAQLKATRAGLGAMLSLLIGEPVDSTTQLARPTGATPPTAAANRRPELSLYDAQAAALRTQGSAITAGLMPRLSLFATGGYGKPGLDMFDDRFRLFGIAGVRLQWNIGALYTAKADRRRIETGIDEVANRREAFVFDTALDTAQRSAEIRKYDEMIGYDDEIIRLRRSVKQASVAKMERGTISGTDLATDINAEHAAVQDKILHETQRLEAIYNLKFATNN